MTPSEVADAPPDACGVPDTGTGGQNEAQLPSQVEAGPVSFANRYKVRPCGSTRTSPSPVSRAVTTVEDGEVLSGELADPELVTASPRAAASALTPAPPAT